MEKPRKADFTLVNAAAQRARQLMQGAAPLERTTSRKPAAIATREVFGGLIPVYYPGEIPMNEDALASEEETVDAAETT